MRIGKAASELLSLLQGVQSPSIKKLIIISNKLWSEGIEPTPEEIGKHSQEIALLASAIWGAPNDPGFYDLSTNNVHEYINEIRKAQYSKEAESLPDQLRYMIGQHGPVEGLKHFQDFIAEKESGLFEKIRSNRAGFKLLKLCNIDLAKPDYQIEKFLQKNITCAIIGPSGSGKSFYALYMACCIAAGIPFFGRKVLSPGPVVLVIGEGFTGIPWRTKAFCIVNQIEIDDLPIFVSTIPTALTDPESIRVLEKELSRIAEIAGPPAAIIFDTLNRSFGAGDENSTADMTKVISSSDYLRSLYGSIIIYVHHSGHKDNSRARGSSAFYAFLDVEFLVTRNSDGIITVKNTKQKEGPISDPEQFKLAPVGLGINDDDGSEITSAVLRKIKPVSAIESTDQKRSTWTPRGEHQKAIIAHFAGAIKNSSAEHPVFFSHVKTACLTDGIPRQRIFDMKNRLIKEGIISVSNTDLITVLDESFFQSFAPLSVVPYFVGGTGQTGQGEE